METQTAIDLKLLNGLVNRPLLILFWLMKPFSAS
ncbi:hypothetical protein BVRB_6g135720 [Beta vulgaris subsp. vulgaris]|nr:hypothetical protein BVRB_6g135720 [Beta vulgaris subsp. vulgaris]